MDIPFIQKQLNRLGLDGWLLYDFQGINPLARRLAGFDREMITRRWFCLVPTKGEPMWLVSRIERSHFDGKPGTVRTYMSWPSLRDGLASMLAGRRKVAMEYAPGGTIPYVSRVDMGTIELVRAAGGEVVSSADLIQWCLARFTPPALATHLEASRHLYSARDAALAVIGEHLTSGRRITEYDVQQVIAEYFAANGLVTNGQPIVAAGRHTNDPHYQPSESGSAAIEEGELVLLDLWAKLDSPGAVYADITWMAFAGEQVPDEYGRIFTIVVRARDAAIAYVQGAVERDEEIRGWQVDDAARAAVVEAGYGESFIHRTGHNIGIDDHGIGVNFDNLETHDERVVIPDVCCSVEPGIYLDLFGIRSEVNIYIGDRRAEITTVPVQRQITPLLRAR